MLVGIGLICLIQGIKYWDQWAIKGPYIILMTISSLLTGLISFHYLRNRQVNTPVFNNLNHKIFVMGSLGLILTAFFISLSKPSDNIIVYSPLENQTAFTEPIKNGQIKIVKIPQGKTSLLDWLKLFSSGDLSRYEGKEIEVTGYVIRKGGFINNQFSVNRLSMTCCSINPVPVGINVLWDSAGTLAENTWVKVTGIIQINKKNGEAFPIIQARSVEKIFQPEQSTLFNP